MLFNELKRGIKNRARYMTTESYKSIKDLYTICKEGGFDGYLKKLNVKLSDMNSDNVIVIFDDKIIKATMTIGACTGILNVENTPVPVIIIESRFKDTEIEKALYYHELGHVVNELRTKENNKRVYSHELRADLYAADKIGGEKYVDALIKLRDDTFGKCTEEIDMRIAEITVQCGLDW